MLGRQNQTSGYAAVEEYVPPGPQAGHYVAVSKVRPGSAPGLACMCNGYSQMNLHFSAETQKSEITPKPTDRTSIGKIHAGEIGVALI
jgi:hypothetical protein